MKWEKKREKHKLKFSQQEYYHYGWMEWKKESKIKKDEEKISQGCLKASNVFFGNNIVRFRKSTPFEVLFSHTLHGYVLFSSIQRENREKWGTKRDESTRILLLLCWGEKNTRKMLERKRGSDHVLLGEHKKSVTFSPLLRRRQHNQIV